MYLFWSRPPVIFGLYGSSGVETINFFLQIYFGMAQRLSFVKRTCRSARHDSSLYVVSFVNSHV